MVDFRRWCSCNCRSICDIVSSEPNNLKNIYENEMKSFEVKSEIVILVDKPILEYH